MVQGVLVAWVWLAVGVFAAGCAWRAWRYASAPVHLRWDLYPVAHEPAARRAYGGSSLEDPEYWTKSPRRSLVGEWTTMLEEILVLRGVWHHNRRIYWGSLPFHWGMYLLIATSGGMALSAVGWRSGWLMALSRLLAITGGTLIVVGALRLLVLRTTDRGLRRYTAPLDRINLGLFALVGALSAIIPLGADGMGPVSLAVGRLLRFEPPQAPPLVVTQITLSALILFYLPFTRMVHFFAKYFLYHDVRWDDRPVRGGSRMERRLRGALDFGVTWSAAHVGAGRPWRGVATEIPPQARKSS